jgi:glyoxylase-like metal-dependent hydrolase (beta-lactamase superfamily II)
MGEMTRRHMLVGAVAATAVAAAQGRAAPVAQAPGFYRYRLGDLTLTAINDGVWHRPMEPDFVRNAAPAEVRAAMAEAFMPLDGTLPLPFTALVVDNGTRRVLIDTGTGGQIAPTARMLETNLAAAGFAPKSIDLILISHFHPDHINGIKTKDDALVFPKAEIAVPAAEWRYWMDDAHLARATGTQRLYLLNARRIFRNIAGDVRRFEPEREVAAGIFAISASGHTPGHTAFAVVSGDRTMLVLSDTTSHPWLFCRHPEWQPVFDMDGPQAVATRRRLLDRAVVDRMLVQGYHFPFPACGHIVRQGSGYDFLPVQWQPAP